jgi:uncharacterized membrane protein YbaN (DUF454 family)
MQPDKINVLCSWISADQVFQEIVQDFLEAKNYVRERKLWETS